jgi:hypothetical protein
MERDQVIEAVKERAKENRISCAVCFKIAEEYGIPKEELGALLDELKVKVVECQLGMFKCKLNPLEGS